MAKLDWASSFLSFRMSEKDDREASQVPDATRQYLHGKKYDVLQQLLSVDPTDNSQNSLVTLAKAQGAIEILDEILQFLTPGDPADNPEDSLD